MAALRAHLLSPGNDKAFAWTVAASSMSIGWAFRIRKWQTAAVPPWWEEGWS
jgi:hypothetical protein